MAKIEFMAGLYLSTDGPYLPAHMIDAVLINGAKKSKEGITAKSAAFCSGPALLQYNGPRDAEALWQDENFRFSVPVRVGNARVIRTRPKFDNWSAIITIDFEPSLVNEARIDDWLNKAGSQIGLGDWRPQHGRFYVQRL